MFPQPHPQSLEKRRARVHEGEKRKVYSYSVSSHIVVHGSVLLLRRKGGVGNRLGAHQSGGGRNKGEGQSGQEKVSLFATTADPGEGGVI